MNKKEYHNALGELRIKTFHNNNAKRLLGMFEVLATNDDEFYKKLSRWMKGGKKYSTVYLRDELALQFKGRFHRKNYFLAWDDAWSWLDASIEHIRIEKG